MLAILRFILVLICCIFICIGGLIYSLIRFRNPTNVQIISRWFGRLGKFFGLDVEHRFANTTPNTPCIYIANHQNNYDMVTISYMVRPRTVSVGKKSLIWIPFFGLMYWASGNILIDRNNRRKGHHTMDVLAKRMHKENLSIWMFPEGTRSRGRGLLPFKTGAFHAALDAQVPIIPVVCSTTQGKVKFNRWNNGKVICEEMAPIDVSSYSKDSVRDLAAYCHDIMEKRIAELDAEIAQEQQSQ